MSAVRNVWIALKAHMRRRVSKEDLYSFSEGMILRPPLPDELFRAFNESFVRFEGNVVSLSEWYRKDHFLPALESIAAQPTWAMQRTKCLELILDETHWRNSYYCYKEAKSDLGRSMILSKVGQLWPNSSDEELAHYLLQFYLVTITCAAALTAVATSLFGVDKTKKMEFELYLLYQRDIFETNVEVMDAVTCH